MTQLVETLDPVEMGFRGPQVCALVGISYRQLDYWARTGLLRPSISEAQGSGSKRRYSYHDVLELKVIKQLLDAGISLQSARRAVDCLREDLGADLASANLVLTGTRSVLARGQGEIVDLLAGGQGVFNVVPLAGVVDELAADVIRVTGDGGGVPSREASGSVDGSADGSMDAVGSARSGSRGPDIATGSWHVAEVGRRGHPSLFPAGGQRFAHPSERLFAVLLDLHAIRWAYEPTEFALEWDDSGTPVSGFRPDFWLPDHECFVELTTANQRLVTKKNAKMRRMRELYPEVQVAIVYQRDFHALLDRYGIDRTAVCAA